MSSTSHADGGVTTKANRRVVDWIDKQDVKYPAIPDMQRIPEFSHTKHCLVNAVTNAMHEYVDGCTDHEFRISLQDNLYLTAADEALRDGTEKCLCDTAWTATEFWILTDRAGYSNLDEIDAIAKKYLMPAAYRDFTREVYIATGVKIGGLEVHES